MWFKIIKMIKYKHAQEKKWPRPSIDEKIVRDTCLCPKGPSILAFYWLQKEKIKLSLPYPPMQCCAAVKATIGKFWMEPGRGVDCYVVWSYPIQVWCVNNFRCHRLLILFTTLSRFTFPWVCCLMFHYYNAKINFHWGVQRRQGLVKLY